MFNSILVILLEILAVLGCSSGLFSIDTAAIIVSISIAVSVMCSKINELINELKDISIDKKGKSDEDEEA